MVLIIHGFTFLINIFLQYLYTITGDFTRGFTFLTTSPGMLYSRSQVLRIETFPIEMQLQTETSHFKGA